MAHSESILRAIREAPGGGALPDGSLPPGGGPAGILAAEVLRLAGAEGDARKQLETVVRHASLDEDRARALYLLGELEFFRERYVSPPPKAGAPPRASAQAYWRLLQATYPTSEWARRTERPTRYLRLAAGEPVPDVRGTFALGATTVERSLSELRGRIVILDYWSSPSAGERALQTGLASDVRRHLSEIPELGDKLSVLGIHLGARLEDVARVVAEWEIPWPQLHDGQGFRTPFAEELGIPRAPHLVILDPEGKTAYIGGDPAAARAVLAREAAKLRGPPSAEEGG